MRRFLLPLLALSFVTVVPAAHADYATSVAADGADVHFPFSEPSGSTATDRIGGLVASGNSGVTFGGETGPLVVEPSPSVKISGTTGAVTIPHSPKVGLASASWSVEFWFRPVETNADRYTRPVITKVAGYNQGFTIHAGRYNVYFSSYDNYTRYAMVYDHESILHVGQWNHVVLAHDPAVGLSFYVNGRHMSTEAPLETPVLQNTQPLKITANADTEDDTAAVSQLAFYDSALSAAQVLRHSQIARNDTTPPAIKVTGPASGSSVTYDQAKWAVTGVGERLGSVAYQGPYQTTFYPVHKWWYGADGELLHVQLTDRFKGNVYFKGYDLAGNVSPTAAINVTHVKSTTTATKPSRK